MPARALPRRGPLAVLLAVLDPARAAALVRRGPHALCDGPLPVEEAGWAGVRRRLAVGARSREASLLREQALHLH